MYKKVLIIDDEQEIGLLLSAAMKKKGFAATFTNDLTNGLKLFEDIHPDILFLDIHFPNGNGLDYIADFKKIHKDVVLIVISAYDTPHDRHKAFSKGADEFISKPFNLQKINSLLQLYTVEK